MNAQVELGRHIRRVRRKRGMTLPSLAAVARLSKGLVSKLERGQVSPSLGTLQKLATALKIVIRISPAPTKRVEPVQTGAPAAGGAAGGDTSA